MAAYESPSSSEESEVDVYVDVQADIHGLQPYQFEPRRTDSDSDVLSEEEGELTSDNETKNEHEEDRDGNTNWCLCQHCSHEWLLCTNEHICCKEIVKTRALAGPCNIDDSICVTNNADFGTVCLIPVVLRNVLVALNNVRADHWNVNPPDNKSLRYAAYRQFTWWAHGKLGPGRRRVIPACATHAIRTAFPKGEGEEYEGYHTGAEDDE